MVEDSTLQIFLTIYHGQLLATFFYDYIIRNVLRLYFEKVEWNIISNIAIGVFFIVAIIWAILSVWGKIRRNLIICAIVLLIVFIIRLSIGIPDLMDKKRSPQNNNKNQYYWTEFWIFIAQMVIHVFGVIATWLLSNKGI